MIKKILNFFFIVGVIVLSRKILAFFLYLFYLIITTLVLIYFFFYLPYIEKIKYDDYSKIIVPNNVTTSTMEDVCYLTDDKKSSFNNFPFQKEKGAIRIGAFGDSHTRGDEVDYYSDFPNILQEIFIKNGYKNVEVLNFGNGGWGNFSSFRLWELEGKKYDLDFILFGPSGFWAERDLTFNWEISSPEDIHGRYILEKDNIKYIRPIGGLDVNERFKAYHSFIPKLRYLLYDKNPLAIIKSLLKEDKTIKNPFYYYQGRLEEEYSRIYGHLFKKISKEVKQIINIAEMNFKLNFVSVDFNKIDNFYYSDGYLPYNDLLSAPNLHAGVLRNNLLAQEYFNILTKKGKHDLSFIKTTTNVLEEDTFLNSPNIYDLNNITIDFENVIIGTMISNIKDKLQKNDNFDNLDSLDFFKDNNLKSLLCLKTENKDFEESLFLPLDFEIESGMELYFNLDGEKENKILGKVELISNNIGIIESSFLSFYEIYEFVGRRIRSGELVLSNLDNDIVDSLYLEEEAIYDIIKVDDKRFLKPTKYNHFIFRSETSHPRHLDEYEDKGNLYLSLRKDNEIIEKYKIGNWEKSIVEYPIDAGKIKYYIKKTEGREDEGEIVENTIYD